MIKILTQKELKMITREYLHDIQCRCLSDVSEGVDPNWIRSYMDLHYAAFVLDAFIARSSVNSGAQEIPDVPQQTLEGETP
jgi:hypothetical protein